MAVLVRADDEKPETKNAATVRSVDVFIDFVFYPAALERLKVTYETDYFY